MSLPEPSAYLTDYCSSVSDGDHQAPPKATEGVPFITISAMNDGKLNLQRATRFVPRSYYDGLHSTRRAVRGDILYSVTGSFGIPAAVNVDTPFVFQRHIALVRPSPALCDPLWLAYMLACPQVFAQSQAIATGTAQMTVPLTGLRKLRLPVVPLAEQRRIVAKLDALIARLTRARAELDRVPVLAEHLRAQTLRDAFANVSGPVRPMGELVKEVRYGTAKKCDYNGGATPVLRIPNVQGGRIDLSDLKSADFDAKELCKLVLRVGDVLVIRSNGSLDLVGRAAVVDEAAAGMLYAGYLIRLRPDHSLVQSDYIGLYLASPASRGVIENVARSTSGVNNVNAQQLQALRVPVPSLKEQAVTVAAVQAAFARAGRMEAEAAHARALLDRLEAAILARAFRGELVPQDPADDPASILLDRIRAQRADQPKSKRGRRPAAKATV